MTTIKKIKKTIPKTKKAVVPKPVKKAVAKKTVAVKSRTEKKKRMVVKASVMKTVARKKTAAKKVVSSGKPKVAIVSLTSCEGCQFALLDLGEKFLDLASTIEMVDFRLIEDEDDLGGKLDVAVVEGNPATKENRQILQDLRKRATVLVTLGNCAAMGGIPEIKNYQEGANTIKHVYKYIQGIENSDVHEVDNFVKVDFVFPGCPITAEEFMEYFPKIVEVAMTGDWSKIPVLPDQPVCLQCRQMGNKCLLLEKKPCFGPMILGGCHAVCPTARMGCQGCRGLRPTGNVRAMKQTLRTMMTDQEFEDTTEIYGLRDDVEERESKTGDNLKK